MQERPRVGMGVLIVRDNRVLLGRRRGSHGAGFYAAPGGHVEAGETLAACARREVWEETGLTVTDLRLLCVGTYEFAGRPYVDVDLLAVVTGEPELREPQKCEGWAWYSLDALPAPLFPVTAQMITAYRQGGIGADLETLHRL